MRSALVPERAVGAEEGAGVNRFSFYVRRVFHRLGQLGVKMTRGYGLTPSRFDLMRAIECQRQTWVPHRDVRELLGVRGPTVSRMVKALVERGYLVRRRDPEDARRSQIGLTRTGRRALCCAFRHIVKSGYMREVTGRALSDHEDFGRASNALTARCYADMMELLESLRRNLGDTSRFQQPDDGSRPLPIEHPIFEPDHDEQGNWPGDDPPLYDWIANNLPLPGMMPEIPSAIAA
jgi:DNA-binding MarR family transcriptional regulator